MSTVKELLQKINEQILNPVIAVLFALALLIFVWGGIQFLSKAASPEGRETGKRHLIYGLLGMFIMAGVYGILNILLRTIGATLPL